MKGAGLLSPLLVSVITAAGSGCGGGGGGGGSCGGPACGGDVVGHWVVSSACVDEAALAKRVLGSDASCGGTSLSNITPMPFGEVTFNSDSTYTISLAMDLVFKVNTPRACLGGGDCMAAETVSFLDNLIGNEGVGSIACGGDAMCSCNEVGELDFGTARLQDSSGSYSLSGTTLAISSSTGVTDSGSYCVQGNTLSLALTGMSSGMSVLVSDLVFRKS
jgi:hypothetical protein